MKKNKGFTLIEILIALTVFAVLATITSSTLFYAFNTRTRVNTQAQRLGALQLAVSIMQQDISQMAQRGVRGNEMRLFSAFIGQEHYLEFTRDGNINPQSIEKRSTLKRVALVCSEGKLLRRTWTALDPVNRNIYEDKVLIDKLNDCNLKYLNRNLQPLEEWHEQTSLPTPNSEHFPKAIQLNITLEDWGAMNLLFIIPGALYANS